MNKENNAVNLAVEFYSTAFTEMDTKTNSFARLGTPDYIFISHIFCTICLLSYHLNWTQSTYGETYALILYFCKTSVFFCNETLIFNSRPHLLSRLL